MILMGQILGFDEKNGGYMGILTNQVHPRSPPSSPMGQPLSPCGETLKCGTSCGLESARPFLCGDVPVNFTLQCEVI